MTKYNYHKVKQLATSREKQINRARERFAAGAGEYCGLLRTKCGGGYRVTRLPAPY